MTQVRRLLGGARGPRPLTLAEHERLHGPDRHRDDLVELVHAAGLRGRGGGGFPVARKLRTALEAPGRPVVVANCAEGEPASDKDRTLLAADPHLVLDGAQAAARAVRAREVVVAVHVGQVAEALHRAVAERPREVRMRVVEIGHGYVRSEASAVVSAASGGPGLPTSRRAPLAESGPGGRPWLVQNAETLAHVALLTRHGLDWYRQTGSVDEPGTVLVTVRGAAPVPQVLEVPVGTPLRAALEAAGGLPEPVQAVLTGGFAGRWLPAPAVFDAPLSHDGMRCAGGTLGAGLVVALPVSACGLRTTAAVLRYLASQSARQCGPCLHGLPALADALDQLVRGQDVLERLRRWCGLVAGRGACSHPDGAVALLRSALEVFAEDAQAHLRHGCDRPALDVGVPR